MCCGCTISMSTGIAKDILPSTPACLPPPSNTLSNLDISHSQYHPICELHASLPRSPNGNCLNYVLQNAVLEAAVWMSANEQDWPLETSEGPAAVTGTAHIPQLQRWGLQLWQSWWWQWGLLCHSPHFNCWSEEWRNAVISSCFCVGRPGGRIVPVNVSLHSG